MVRPFKNCACIAASVQLPAALCNALSAQRWGVKSLDNILANQVTASEIAIKDIVLSGEVKEILNHVVGAEKEAQANSIRRRKETNATRSLLNTAKVMEYLASLAASC